MPKESSVMVSDESLSDNYIYDTIFIFLISSNFCWTRSIVSEVESFQMLCVSLPSSR